MECKITASKSFNKELKRLGKRYASLADDYETLLHDLKQNPTLGTDLGRGLRKVRMRISSKGKGKSGGARVITFTVIRENISPKEIDALLIANGFIAQP